MKPETAAQPTLARESAHRFFSIVFGVFLGLTLVKFGNVAVFDQLVEWPANGFEWLLSGWPVSLGYGLLLALALVGVFVARWKATAPTWLVILPLAWLVWQFVAATHSVDAALTRATVKHFAACAVCFYLGYFTLGRAPSRGFLVGLVVGLVIVIVVGLEQHFGGLEDTRRYFFTYVYPHQPTVAPEFLKKISSNRIFSTLFYPNALAGVLLLLLPVTLTAIKNDVTRLTAGARTFVAAVVGVAALACLYWSGSKGGWLLMLLLGLIALFQVPFDRRWKIALAVTILALGLAGFGLKYAGFFQRGATSVSARFDYWSAALRTTAAHPVFGTGPGTFSIPYSKIKRPESEMARLTHNDYLQQASDSGVVGFVTYAAFIIGGLVWTRPRAVNRSNVVRFAIWLGLLGWCLQGFLEFGLYIPALAWCEFTLMGWLLATNAKPFDKPEAAAYPKPRK